MIDLNQICISIRLGDNQKVSTLFKHYKVASIINSAVRKIKKRNPEYNDRLLKDTVETEIWNEISNKYNAASDTTKGNNLALRFIKAIAYNKLMNFVREDKRLKWTCDGYIHKFNTVSIDMPVHVEQDTRLLSDTLIDESANADIMVLQQYRIAILKKALTRAVALHLNSPIDNFMILLRYNESMTYSEIKQVLLQQFKIKCTVSWISQRIAHGLKMLLQVLEQFRPKKGEDVL